MKKSVLTVALACVSMFALAQENGNRDENNRIIRGPYETNRFFDNWFIQAGAGASVYLGGQNAGEFSNRIRPVFDISLGKWITPTIGLRTQFNYSPSMRQYSGSYSSPYTVRNGTMQKFNFLNLHGDVMWNLSAAISGYRENRVYEIIPYLGAGWVQTSYKDVDFRKNELAVNFGIINKFRVSRAVDINLELRSTLANGRLDASNIKNRIDLPVAATIGLTYRFGKVKGFKRAQVPTPVDYSDYNRRIRVLENENSNLAGKNKQLADEIEVLRNRKPEVVSGESKISASPVALFFNLGKATLDKKELVNLEFYVKNAIKVDKNKTFTLIGSADSATGSKEVNQRLSEQRMQYVFDLLVNKYGVSQDRLIKKAEGDTNNRFDEPALNRVVIVE